MFIVADEQALRVGGKGGLAGAGETEEDGGVIAFHIGVGGAVHRGDTLQRQVVVHHGEHTLLHFAAVPGVDDDLFTGGDVEGNGCFGVQSHFLEVFNLGLGGAVNGEIRGEGGLFFFSRFDEHVADKVGLPGNFHDEADSHAGVMVGTAEGIHDKQAFAGEFFDSDIFQDRPVFFAQNMVVIRVFRGVPPDGVFGVLVHDDIFVLRRTSGVNAGHDIDSAEFSQLTLFVTGQFGLHFFFVKHFVRRIVNNFRGSGNSILVQINFCHYIFLFFLFAHKKHKTFYL